MFSRLIGPFALVMLMAAPVLADDAKDEAYKFEQNMVKGFGKDRDDYARALQDKTGAIQ